MLSSYLFFASFHSLDVCDGGIRLVFHSSTSLLVVGKGHHSVLLFQHSHGLFDVIVKNCSL